MASCFLRKIKLAVKLAVVGKRFTFKKAEKELQF